MGSTRSLLLLILIKTCLSINLDDIFKKINTRNGNFNAIAATIAWESAINSGNPELPKISSSHLKKKIAWQLDTCNELSVLFKHQLLNDTQKRQSFLLCRGPKFTFNEARLISKLYEELQSIYSDAEICIPIGKKTAKNGLSNIENAIVNYLSKVKKFLNYEHADSVLFSAKTAVNANPDENNRVCLKGENDFEKMMTISRQEEVLRWLWLVWREKVGPPMKRPYIKLVFYENKAVMRNGNPNIGASWRDELEMPRLRKKCRHLYDSAKRLYSLIHGVVRFYLRRFYGDIVPKRGSIPAHLLRNLWSQNWEPLSDLMLPKNIDLDKQIKELNWTVEYMVKRAEDFYQSLGLPPMTKKFWRKSIFTWETNKNARCHGTAVDMFQDGDYRLLYCSETSMEDFYVLHHELGHIQYYMAYAHQKALFRQANSALHETIGDAIMYGVLTPQHLNRLGLINDSLLYTTPEYIASIQDNNVVSHPGKNIDLNIIKNKKNLNSVHIIDHNEAGKDLNKFNVTDGVKKVYFKKKTTVVNYKERSGITHTPKYNNINNRFEGRQDKKNLVPELFRPEELTVDMILLFKQALNKLPQIPFALVIDEYRWRYFEGSLKNGEENKKFWELVEELQGVAPIEERGEEYFDIGALFHVPDNTPYIRYFLSSFLQHQLFEKLCKAAVYGKWNTEHELPDTITVSRCDIYGSKAAGKLLKDLMSRGHSQPWNEILQATINETDITASALNKFYRPLTTVLERFVMEHRVPIGW